MRPLRGLPVAVGGSPEHRGVVAAASYEARAFGVRSAIPMARAVRLCPSLVIVRPDFTRYRAASQAVFEARQRHRQRTDLLLLSATYWILGGKPETSGLAFEQARMGHACEWETSMMLRLAPHLVGDLATVEPAPFGAAFEPALATALSNHAVCLSDLGRREDALIAIEESIAIRRRLVRAHPDAFDQLIDRQG